MRAPTSTSESRTLGAQKIGLTRYSDFFNGIGQKATLADVQEGLSQHRKTLCMCKTRDRVMNPSREDKLISLLTEIHSDLRQIKSDLQSLLTLLKQQQQKPSRSSFPNNDETANAMRARSQACLRTSFAICGKREGRMIREKPVSMPLSRKCRLIVHFSQTRSRLWVLLASL